MAFKIQSVDVSFAMSKILSLLAEGNTYKNWDDKFCREELTRAFDKATKEFSKIDYTKCSKEELMDLGFMQFSDQSNIMLIPLWLYNSLPDGVQLESVFGKPVIKGIDYIDNDVRCGCLAYGIEVKN